MARPNGWIDVDSHVQEKPDTWTSRMSKARWGDRIPHLVEKGDGSQAWSVDGKVLPNHLGVVLCPAAMPLREGPTRWEQVPKAVYEASERLKMMRAEGIEVQAFYPNTSGPSGQAFFGTEPAFELDCVKAYNDYVIDEWYTPYPDNFVPQLIPPYSNMETLLGEVARSARRGHKAVIALAKDPLPPKYDPWWNPFWALVEDQGIVLAYHSSAGGFKRQVEFPPDAEFRRLTAASHTSSFATLAQNLARFLFSGVLERYPKMTVVTAEQGLGWIPYVLESCDRAWEEQHLSEHGLSTKPSDLFRRQMYIDFWYEQVGLSEYRHIIGVDRICWETDYPHPTALHPNTREFVERSFQGIPADERELILVDNARKLYSLN